MPVTLILIKVSLIRYSETSVVMTRDIFSQIYPIRAFQMRISLNVFAVQTFLLTCCDIQWRQTVDYALTDLRPETSFHYNFMCQSAQLSHILLPFTISYGNIHTYRTHIKKKEINHENVWKKAYYSYKLVFDIIITFFLILTFQPSKHSSSAKQHARTKKMNKKMCMSLQSAVQLQW